MAERAKRITRGAGAVALACGAGLLVASTGLLARLLASDVPMVVRVAPGDGFWRAVTALGGGSLALSVVALGASLLLSRADSGWSWRRIAPVAAVVCGIVTLATGWGVAALSSQQIAASARGISAEIGEAVERSIWAYGAGRVAVAAAVGLSGVALAARGLTGRRGSVGFASAAVAAWLCAAVAQCASLGVDASARKLAWGVYWVAGPRDVAHAVEAGLVVAAGAALCAGILAAANADGRPVEARDE